MVDPIGYMLHGINWPRMPKSFGRKTLTVAGLTSLLAGVLISSEFKEQRTTGPYSRLRTLENPSNNGSITPIPYTPDRGHNILAKPYSIDVNNGSGSIRIAIPDHSYDENLDPFNQDTSL